MEQFFAGASNMIINATDKPILSSVTNMDYMFYSASGFNEDISDWDVSNITSMYGAFANATRFNQSLSSWNVSWVIDMGHMFQGTFFNQPLNAWNVSSVKTMASMFQGARNFNQDLSAWDIRSVEDLNLIFLFSNLSTQNYDKLLSSWGLQIIKSNVLFGAGNTKYSPSLQAARDLLTNT